MRRSGWFLVATLVVVGVAFVAVLVSGARPVLGLDLQGGISVVLAPVGDPDSEALDKTVDIVRNRVDALGVAEPEVSRQGDNIIVDLPGVDDAEKARSLVGATAELQFRQVLAGPLPLEESDATTTTTTGAPDASASTAPGETTTTTATTTTTTTTVPPATVPGETTPLNDTTTTTAPAESQLPLTPPEERDAEQVVFVGREIDGEAVKYVLGPIKLAGSDVQTASADFQSGQGWAVILELKSEGQEKFNALAAESFSQQPPMNQVAIALDGEVQSAPAFQEASFPGDVSITGDFSQSEAEDLGLVLRYGALPVVLEEESVDTVSPTLGKDQLRAGIAAGLIGLGLVMIYMVLYYRILGLVVWVGLGLTGITLWCLVSWLGAAVGLTLTLAGVTGLIVSVGVTVDSYVVYFERLKDEVRTGKTVRSSLDRGFQRSFRTILAADLVSLIGAAILYWLAVGSVRGFAFFLGLSTLIDLLISYFFMHPLVVAITRRPRLLRARWFGVASGLDAEGVTT